jgi:hypothetical protein
MKDPKETEEIVTGQNQAGNQTMGPRTIEQTPARYARSNQPSSPPQPNAQANPRLVFHPASLVPYRYVLCGLRPPSTPRHLSACQRDGVRCGNDAFTPGEARLRQLFGCFEGTPGGARNYSPVLLSVTPVFLQAHEETASASRRRLFDAVEIDLEA